MNNRVTGDPVAPRKLNPNISPQAEEIVLRAMQRNPADRFPTAAAFKTALDMPGPVRLTGYMEEWQEKHNPEAAGPVRTMSSPHDLISRKILF